MKKILAIFGVTGALIFGGTADVIPHDPDVPQQAQIEYAYNATVFDTATGDVEFETYYALEDGSGYIGKSTEFDATTNFFRFSEKPFENLKLINITGYQPRVKYRDGATSFIKDIQRDRYEAQKLPDAKIESFKDPYTVTPFEIIAERAIPTAYAAIAFDATATGGPTTATSITFSHTTTGSNRGLGVGAFTLNDTITGITYNAVGMTFQNKTTYPGAGRIGATEYYLNAPATGANNVVVSASGSVQIIGHSSSYTGVLQTGQPETLGNGSGTGTSHTCAITTVTAQDWMIISDANAAGTVGAGASTNVRQTDANGTGYGDGGPFASGSNTLTFTTGSASWATVCMSIAPAAVANTFNPRLFWDF